MTAALLPGIFLATLLQGALVSCTDEQPFTGGQRGLPSPASRDALEALLLALGNPQQPSGSDHDARGSLPDLNPALERVFSSLNPSKLPCLLRAFSDVPELLRISLEFLASRGTAASLTLLTNAFLSIPVSPSAPSIPAAGTGFALASQDHVLSAASSEEWESAKQIVERLARTVLTDRERDRLLDLTRQLRDMLLSLLSGDVQLSTLLQLISRNRGLKDFLSILQKTWADPSEASRLLLDVFSNSAMSDIFTKMFLIVRSALMNNWMQLQRLDLSTVVPKDYLLVVEDVFGTTEFTKIVDVDMNLPWEKIDVSNILSVAVLDPLVTVAKGYFHGMSDDDCLQLELCKANYKYSKPSRHATLALRVAQVFSSLVSWVSSQSGNPDDMYTSLRTYSKAIKAGSSKVDCDLLYPKCQMNKHRKDEL